MGTGELSGKAEKMLGWGGGEGNLQLTSCFMLSSGSVRAFDSPNYHI